MWIRLTIPQFIFLQSVVLALFVLLSQPASASSKASADASSQGLTPTPTRTPTATAISGCTLAWEIVPSPNPASFGNSLTGVAAISSNDVWAVGGSDGNTMTLHWDGSQWTRVPSPNRGTQQNVLTGVAAISSNDVWAVGWTHSTGGGWLTLTLHWDGTQWSIVPSPNQPTSVENYLEGVSAVSTNDVWAVGYYSLQNAYQTLTMHWNGQQWSIVPSPNVDTQNNILEGVTAISSNDVWAVGDYYNADSRTLVQHWNGSQWVIVPSPNPPNHDCVLESIDAVSGNDAWAVGACNEVAGVTHTLIEHWDGTQWSIVPSPDLDQGTNLLYGVAAISADDAWAVGYYSGDYGAVLIEHWDGVQWSVVPVPNPTSYANFLRGIAAVAPTDVWAVGNWFDCLGCPIHTLTERYSAQCPPSPTPSPSSTPSSTPSLSLTPSPTATLSSSATPSMVSSATIVATATSTTTPTAIITTPTTATPTAISTSKHNSHSHTHLHGYPNHMPLAIHRRTPRLPLLPLRQVHGLQRYYLRLLLRL